MISKIYLFIFLILTSAAYAQEELAQVKEALVRKYQTEIIIFLHKDYDLKKNEIFNPVIPLQESSLEKELFGDEIVAQHNLHEYTVEEIEYKNKYDINDLDNKILEIDKTINSSIILLPNNSIKELFNKKNIDTTQLEYFIAELDEAITALQSNNLGDTYKVGHINGQITHLYKTINYTRALNIEKVGSEFVIKIIDQPNVCKLDDFKPIMLSRDSLELRKEFNYLYNSDLYNPLLHFGWNDLINPNEKKIIRPLCSFISLPDNIKGDLTLYLSRYLHLNVNIQISEPSEKDSLNNLNDELQAIRPITQYINYKINEDRIFRNGELHYFDHPRIGVLAKISRVENKVLKKNQFFQDIEENTMQGFEEIVEDEFVIIEENTMQGFEEIVEGASEETAALSFELIHENDKIVNLYIKYNSNETLKTKNHESEFKGESLNQASINDNIFLDISLENNKFEKITYEDITINKSHEDKIKELFNQKNIAIEQLDPMIEDLKNMINRFKQEVQENSERN